MVRCRRPLILASVVAVAAFALLAAGCGGGGSPEVAGVASSTSAGTTTVENGALTGALAFARCLRSHGIPSWPDPASNGAFDKSKLRQLGVSLSRVRAIEDSACNYVFENGGQPQERKITLADRADYLRAVACMRSHGFPDFPDPTFQNNSVQTNIPSSIDENSSKFKSAAATCVKLIPAGLPYSSSSGS
jgi:hypothetical protein